MPPARVVMEQAAPSRAGTVMDSTCPIRMISPCAMEGLPHTRGIACARGVTR